MPTIWKHYRTWQIDGAISLPHLVYSQTASGRLMGGYRVQKCSAMSATRATNSAVITIAMDWMSKQCAIQAWRFYTCLLLLRERLMISEHSIDAATYSNGWRRCRYSFILLEKMHTHSLDPDGFWFPSVELNITTKQIEPTISICHRWGSALRWRLVC